MDGPPESQVELEQFRRQWQEEVTRRNRQIAKTSSTPSTSSRPDRPKLPAPAPAPSSTYRTHPKETIDLNDDNENDPQHAYHDLPDKEDHLRLDAADRSPLKVEPKSALEHYERAVERESDGSLGDSLKHYRKAFKVRQHYLFSLNILPLS